MYRWYQKAAACYVHLVDFDIEHGSDAIFTAGHDDLDNLTWYMNEEIEETGTLRKCRWFTRGWTLQELIAPEAVTFFDRS